MSGMAGTVERGSRWRIGLWSGAAGLLLVPLAAMRFTDEVRWTSADFLFAAVLLAGAGGALEVLVRRSPHLAYRAGAALAVLTAFLLVWIDAAVGLIAGEGDDANLVMLVVVLTALAGAAVARLRASGMARAMAATALAQGVLATVALTVGLGAAEPKTPSRILGLTVLFVALWLGSAALFRTAARATR